MQSPTPAGGVRCDSLVVRYGEFAAVDGVTFTAEPGEVIGLLGPNGAGKTSVIRALTTVLDPASGSATVAGAALSDPMGIRRRIGVLPESSGYPGSQRASDYLRFYGRLFGLDRPEATRRTTSLLDSLGLRERQDARIRTFSRGMRQRLGIARALINDPAVLFLDEPTLGLDPAGKQDILAHIEAVAHDRGATVLVSSHLLEEIERACDRVVILHRGHVAASGTVVDVVRAAGIGGRIHIRIAPEDVATANELLGALAQVDAIEAGPSGELEITVIGPSTNGNELATVLIDSGIVIQRFEVAPGRLGDAFFALTERGGAPPEANHAA